MTSPDLGRQSRRLWSLLDMLPLEIQSLLIGLRKAKEYAVELEAADPAQRVWYSEIPGLGRSFGTIIKDAPNNQVTSNVIESLFAFCVPLGGSNFRFFSRTHGLLLTLRASIFLSTDQDFVAAREFHRSVDRIIEEFEHEAREPRFLPLSGTDALAWGSEPERLWPQDVWRSFPSARYDLKEARLCLSIQRSTACVLHLMRALEHVYLGLWLSLHPNHTDKHPQNPTEKIKGWGEFDNLIRQSLLDEARKAPRFKEREPFIKAIKERMSEVRDAYRNAAVHADDIYYPDEAQRILVGMEHLLEYTSVYLDETGRCPFPTKLSELTPEN